MARTAAIAGTYAVGTALTTQAGPQAAAAHQVRASPGTRFFPGPYLRQPPSSFPTHPPQKNTPTPTTTTTTQVCNQLWLASSLLSDALAVAAQSLVAASLAAGQPSRARRVVGRTVGMAAGLGMGMAAALAAGSGSIPALFTADPAVLGLVSGAAWAFVVATQPLNSAAFVWDGVLFGAGGFRFACGAMAASCAPAVAVMLLLAGGGASGADAVAPAAALSGVWAGLAVVMLLRWMTIWVPYQLRMGPFAALHAGGEVDERGEGKGGDGAPATAKA